MKNQILSIGPRLALAPARTRLLSSVAMLVMHAAAQTLLPLRGDSAVQPAAHLYPLGPSMPNLGIFHNVVHYYSPADICAAYGVDALHQEGWTGKGQTIVVVDSYGSPTALQDLQFFSSTYGLAAPDLTIVYVDGTPTYNATALNSSELGSAEETSLDLQWAHV